MITDYATLQTSVLAWINRTNDADAVSVCPLWVQMAENELRMAMSRMMVRYGEVRDPAFSISSEYTNLPDGFIRARLLRLEGNTPRELEYMPPQAIERLTLLTSGADKPKIYTIQGNQLRVIPAPDTTYTATFTYYSLPSLSVSNTTNWLLTAYPLIYLFAVIAYAYDYYKDYAGKADKLADMSRLLTELEITEAQGAAASALRMRVDSSCP